MAKVSGLPTSVTIGGNDLSNDITSFSVATPRGVQDVTGIDKSAMERLLLRSDFNGTFNGVFNTAANKSHATLKTPGSKTLVIAYPGATLTVHIVTTDYSVDMGADGSLTWSAPASLDDGTPPAWT